MCDFSGAGTSVSGPPKAGSALMGSAIFDPKKVTPRLRRRSVKSTVRQLGPGSFGDFFGGGFGTNPGVGPNFQGVSSFSQDFQPPQANTDGGEFRYSAI